MFEFLFIYLPNRSKMPWFLERLLCCLQNLLHVLLSLLPLPQPSPDEPGRLLRHQLPQVPLAGKVPLQGGEDQGGRPHHLRAGQGRPGRGLGGMEESLGQSCAPPEAAVGGLVVQDGLQGGTSGRPRPLAR